jgi:hypothetical protein
MSLAELSLSTGALIHKRTSKEVAPTPLNNTHLMSAFEGTSTVNEP